MASTTASMSTPNTAGGSGVSRSNVTSAGGGGGGTTTTSSSAAGAGAGGGPASGGAGVTSANAATSTNATTNTTHPALTAAAGGGGIPVQAVAMKLLDIRLRPATAIITSVAGEFTAPGNSEIVVLKAGGVLELFRIVLVDNPQQQHKKSNPSSSGASDEPPEDDEEDEEEPRTLFQLITRVETHSILRSCVAIRFPGEKRDVLAVTSDSGCLSVLEFKLSSSSSSSSYKILHCVTFGKTACRRAVPGQYVAADPKGRAVLTAAIEKRKLVYVLNRNAAGQPTIASPLEAHRNRTLTFAVTGLDNGYDNPIFACLEIQYPEWEEGDDSNNNNSAITPEQLDKQLAYYELDLGLNHVSRKWATNVNRSACCLAAVPGGADGPGGVLVGGEDWIEYLHEKKQRLACPIPRRALHPKEKGILITTITVHRQKKSKFFALAQTELGDVYKITLLLGDTDKTVVQHISVALMDTLPVANSLNVSKLGMLFAAAEFGDHYLYQVERIDLPHAPTCSSADAAKTTLFGAAPMTASQLITANAVAWACTFAPLGLLQNLRKVCTVDNASPTTAILVGELAGNEVSPQMYTLTGTGPTSSLRILRHGAAVTELAVSELPGVPGGIFTIANNTASSTAGASSKHASLDNKNDRYIVVSFADATLVLSIGDTVEEVGKESGLLTNTCTLACSALGNDGAICQVHPAGVRQYQRGKALQWNCPGLKRIECGSANHSQVIVALAGGEVIYFELDAMSGNLNEAKTRDMGADVCCLDVGTIPTGRSRSLFAAIGCRDQTVRIVSLEPGSYLVQKSSTALKSRPHSVALQSGSQSADGSSGSVDDITLVIGLDDGSSLRASVDPVTGSIGASPTRRFLGARPVAVSRIRLESRPATLFLSSRPWISRRDASSGKHVMAPLSYVPLDHGCSFSSDAVREGIVATAGKTLRILSVDSAAMGAGDDETFNTNKVELRYTPRQMTLMSAAIAGKPDQRKVVLAVVESNYNEYGLEEKKAMGFDPMGGTKSSKKSSQADDDGMDMDVDSDEEGNKDEDEKKNEDDEEDAEEKELRRTPIRGPVPPGPGHWGSCIRLLDPSNGCETLDCLEMGRNEAALCCASVRFHSKGGEPLLAVGTVTGMTMHPLKVSSSHILLYRVVDGERFQLLHRTTVDDGPVLALAHFQGRLLVGIGQSIRLYEMGKRQLLRKCELRGLPTYVKTLQTVGDRAYIGDLMQSIQIVRYDAPTNRLVLIANDANPRPIVSQELLDWNTVAVGDKFGNISVLRLPRGADAVAVDLSGQRALWDASRDDATPKLELLCQYYIGEVVTGMTRSSLVAGGAECLIYVTVTGRIGALVPFSSRDDVEFFTQLEACLRMDAPRATGRDPQSYRSYYAPIMHVVDGDLCNAFNGLSHEEQSKIADRLDCTIGEILKKLEDTRTALL